MSINTRFTRARNFPIYYGWVIVGIAGISVFFTGPGQTFSFTLFIEHIIGEFGWSRTLISSLYSFATIISGSLMFIVGRFIDRAGARRSALIAAVLLGLACFINSFVFSPAILFIGFFLARFSGQGALGLAAGTLAPRWFLKRRAFAIMLAGLGGTIGSSIFPLLNNYLVTEFGWRTAFRILGGGIWLFYLPIAALVIIDRPEQAGMEPDGGVIEEDRTEVVEEGAFTQGQAVKTIAFWFLSFCLFQSSMVGTGKIFHFISIMSELGYTSSFSAGVMSISPIIGLTVTVVAGLVMDRMRRPQLVLALACVLQVSVYLMLANLQGAVMPYIYAAATGASNSLLMFSVGVLRPFLYGRRYIGGISGMSAVIGVVGSALGPLYMGIVYDVVGGYRVILLLSAILPAIAIVFALLIRKPQLKTQET